MTLSCSFQPATGHRPGCDPEGVEHLGTLWAGPPSESLADVAKIFTVSAGAYEAYAPQALEMLLEGRKTLSRDEVIELVVKANKIASAIAKSGDPGGHDPRPAEFSIEKPIDAITDVVQIGFGSGRTRVHLDVVEPAENSVGQVRLSVLAARSDYAELWPENPTEYWARRLRPLIEAAQADRERRNQDFRGWFRAQVRKHCGEGGEGGGT